MRFFKTILKYLGHIIDEKGQKADPARATAIKSMPPPTSVSTLQTFLEFVNYNSNFIPKMQVLRARLLKKDTK